MKKHLQTKHIILFWFQVGDNKISDVFYKIQKFLRTSWAPIITTNGINFLMVMPLKICETLPPPNGKICEVDYSHILVHHKPFFYLHGFLLRRYAGVQGLLKRGLTLQRVKLARLGSFTNWAACLVRAAFSFPFNYSITICIYICLIFF